MIKGFRDRKTERLWNGETVRSLVSIERQARRKLDALDVAVTLADLYAVPGNHAEALKGKRKGQHSIRINDQYRICFVWTTEGAADVEIVDYH